MKFGDNLKKLRKLKNISQEALAEKVGVSRQSVSKWETGDVYPEMSNILVLCTIFHCKINDLVNDSMIDIDSLDEEVKMNIVKFKKDKQKQMKMLSKAIYVIARICKMFTIVGGSLLIIFMLAFPFLVKEVNVTDNTIKIFNEKVTYEKVDDKITFRPVDKNSDLHEYTLTGKNRVIDTSAVLKALNNNSTIKIVGFMEVAFLFILGSIVLAYFTLRHLEKLFINIHSGETPFSMENVIHIKRMAILLIINIILPDISAIMVEFVSNTNIHSDFDSINILYILFLLSMSYIFEYGYLIQQDSKGQMYGEVEE